jgi:hypothetical protein
MNFRYNPGVYSRRLCFSGCILFSLIISACLPPANIAALEQPTLSEQESCHLPPTWTIVPSTSTVALFSTPRPSATLPLTPTPIPSLTPYDGLIAIIGHSVEGRPLEVVRFGNGAHKRMIISGIHGGNEWNTIALADELIVHLRHNPQLLPDNVSLYILRSLNPDGEARAHTMDGRTNANGVDLNRNFDANWLSDWPREGCWTLRPVTAGPYPASEPETMAVTLFLMDHPVEALINYHSAALGIFPAGDPTEPRSASLAQKISEVSPYPYPAVDTGCIFSGTLVDWAAGLGVAAVDLELSNHTDTDLEINLRILSVLLSWQP